MFAPIFCRGLSWRRSWQIGGSELAMGSLVPASGAGGLALGAWVLHEGGMDADRIARRSVAFFLIKSSVNFVAVAIIGLLMLLRPVRRRRAVDADPAARADVDRGDRGRADRSPASDPATTPPATPRA